MLNRNETENPNSPWEGERERDWERGTRRGSRELRFGKIGSYSNNIFYQEY